MLGQTALSEQALAGGSTGQQTTSAPTIRRALAQGVSIKGKDALAEWEAPYKGILRDMVPPKIPADALWDSQNVVFRNGALIARPGLSQLIATDLTAGAGNIGRVTGANQTTLLASGVFDATAFDPSTFQEAANTPGTVITAGTNRKFWAYFGGVWHDLTDTPLVATDTYLAQFTNIQIGSTVYTLLTNGIDSPRQWDNQSAAITVVAGTPPLFTDWTTASSRIIGIVPPYLVQWGNSLSITTWPAGNFRVLSDTPDPVVAVENIGTLGAVVYKANSAWLAIAQGGLDASYFSFTLFGQYEGPANPNCVVNVSGSHYVFTKSGRCGVFNGSQWVWVNDPILPLLRATLDTANMGRAFGLYNPIDREVWFFYPRLAEAGNGDVRGLMIVSVPKQFSYEGIFFHSTFLGSMAFPVTAGVDRRLDLLDYLAFAQPGGQPGIEATYGFAPNTSDAGQAFSGFWQCPMRGAGKAVDVAKAIGVEDYLLYGPAGGLGTLTRKVVSNYMLDHQGNISTGVDLDMSGPAPMHANLIEGALRGRFFGLRYEFTAPVTLTWYGARLMGALLEG